MSGNHCNTDEAAEVSPEPVSPESCTQMCSESGLYPNVRDGSGEQEPRDARVQVNTGAGADSSSVEPPGSKRQRFRVDRDTEVEVTETSDEPNAREMGETEEKLEHTDVPERVQGERIKRPPKPPSAEEVRIHNATHVPYRAWCPKCIAAEDIEAVIQREKTREMQCHRFL